MTARLREVRGAWIAAVTATVAMVASLAITQAAMARQFEGPVLHKNREAKTFRMDPENRAANVTIKVTNATEFERIAGFGDIKRGQRVEVRASRDGSRWVASKVSK